MVLLVAHPLFLIARGPPDPLHRADLFVVNYQAPYSNWQNSGHDKGAGFQSAALPTAVT